MRLFPSSGYIICAISGSAIALAILKGMDLFFALPEMEEAIIADIEKLSGMSIRPEGNLVRFISLFLHIFFGLIGAVAGWFSFHVCLGFKNLLQKE